MSSTLSSAIPDFTAEQIRQRRITKRGIQLNLLIIGANGSGKRSFVDTLCGGDYFRFGSDEIEPEDLYIGNLLRIETHILNVFEKDSIPIKLRLSLTKNFGYNLENSSTSQDIVDYLESEFQVILDEELKIKRNPKFEDNRVHVALYFIKATGRGLNEFEIENMKAIGQRVNLIPIISKADSLTDDELQMNKEIIKKSIEDNHINVYDFVGLDPGQLDNSEDEEESTYLQLLQDTYPFSIISSAGRDNEGGKYRSTPWGNINIEDHEICNFTLLKNVLLGSHVQEFKDQTIRNQYEAFRIEQLLDKSVVN